MQLTFNINEERLNHFLTNVRGYLGLESINLSQVQFVDLTVKPVFDMLTLDVFFTRLVNDLTAEKVEDQEKIWEENVRVRFEHILQLGDEGQPVMSFRVKQTNGEDEVEVIDRKIYTPPKLVEERVSLDLDFEESEKISVEDRLIKMFGDEKPDEESGLILPPNMK